MATVIERTTKGGARRIFVVFHAIDRETGKRRKVWESQPPASGLREAKLRTGQVENALHASGGLWPAEAPKTKTALVTLEARGEAWLARHRVNVRDRVYANYEASLSNHVYPLLGARPICELGPADAKLLRDTMRGHGLSDSTIKGALVVLRGIVYDWAEDEKLPNPLAGLRLFAKGDAGRQGRKIKPPERDEIDVLVAHARPDASDAILVAAASGLRRGELFGLRWRDIDFAANEIHVTAYNFAGRVEDGRFKTDAGERDVPLFKSIRRLLLERKARQQFSGDDDFVFGTTIGTPQDPGNFVTRELRSAFTAANKTRAERGLSPLPAFRWHDFRHYAVSVLIKQRADILTLARIAGHSDPNVTLKVYGHLMRGAISEAADLYDPLAEASSG